MPGIKSVTITVEFADGSTEVATIKQPREVTFSNRANTERSWGDRLDFLPKAPPSYDFDLNVKDAPGLDWRAHPAPGPYPKPAPAVHGCHAGCHAGRDGDCTWKECPQLRDGEPKATGRHCPLDLDRDEDNV